MPAVDYILPDVVHMLSQYTMITDCVAGETAVKQRGEKYLPMPNAADKSNENTERYRAYKERALFVNVSGRTLLGLVGQVFQREPNIKNPSLLDSVVKDATGLGVTIVQQAKEATKGTLAYGRMGLLIDYPTQDVDQPATMLDITEGNIRPYLCLYNPWDIINWRVTRKGSQQTLSLVVLREPFLVQDDGFLPVYGYQYRVLRLEPDTGNYVVEVYTQQQYDAPVSTYYPTDSAGKNLKEIPFTFLGVSKNDPYIDIPPLYDLCAINMAHYRNSADYEESIFLVGQPTPVLTGLTQQWYEEVLKKTVNFGSRGGIPLPAGGDAKLLQAAPNQIAKEAMDAKERQMVAIGARLVQQTTVQRTATEADQENSSETSILSSVAGNVAAAYKWALEWCGIFVGTGEGGIEFDLNTEFDLVTMDPLERAQLLKEWQSGGISFTEYRDNLKRSGVATQDDGVAKTEIEAEQQAEMQKALEAAQGQADIQANAGGNDSIPAGGN